MPPLAKYAIKRPRNTNALDATSDPALSSVSSNIKQTNRALGNAAKPIMCPWRSTMKATWWVVSKPMTLNQHWRSDFGKRIDYVYLEDVSRQSDTLTRHRIKDNKTTSPADYKLRLVVKQARGLGVLYDMLPAGMSRRKANRTNYSTK